MFPFSLCLICVSPFLGGAYFLLDSMSQSPGPFWSSGTARAGLELLQAGLQQVPGLRESSFQEGPRRGKRHEEGWHRLAITIGTIGYEWLRGTALIRVCFYHDVFSQNTRCIIGKEWIPPPTKCFSPRWDFPACLCVSMAFCNA